ncbi:hypothetical protein B0H14DRAFT_3167359 [Mycena olivaceomarginata]|nr:hypothetical protein B0H14DRAFT_3167359 [Mycena olivaceomarginata]
MGVARQCLNVNTFEVKCYCAKPQPSSASVLIDPHNSTIATSSARWPRTEVHVLLARRSVGWPIQAGGTPALQEVVIVSHSTVECCLYSFSRFFPDEQCDADRAEMARLGTVVTASHIPRVRFNLQAHGGLLGRSCHYDVLVTIPIYSPLLTVFICAATVRASHKVGFVSQNARGMAWQKSLYALFGAVRALAVDAGLNGQWIGWDVIH